MYCVEFCVAESKKPINKGFSVYYRVRPRALERKRCDPFTGIRRFSFFKGQEAAMYWIDFSDSNRLYRTEEGTCEVLDPAAITWHPGEPAQGWQALSDRDAEMYLKALEIAKEAHKGQKDKGGNDYFSHPVSVSALTRGSLTAVISALLHDTVEDTSITLGALRELGMSEEVTACVDCLTHREGEPRKDYLERIAGNYDAVCVKLADLTHNSDLSRIADPREKDYQRIEKYRKEYEALSIRKAELEGKMNHA
jgi:hypothetical protein